jgi:hypothetical protein
MKLRQEHPILRSLCIGAGILLLIGAIFVGPIPGPGGVFFVAGGLALILPNSPWAMRQFVRWKRKWPKTGAVADRVMRRPSEKRRRERVGRPEQN